jgi:NAD(P)-dependent dehydrogenase (short-subunit alcohol dehydrogenase family)
VVGGEVSGDVAGATAVVVGGASGIGAGIAAELGRRDARVILADIAADRLEKVREELAAAGSTVETAVVDATDAEAVERLAVDVFARHGSVKVLVNAAGVELTGYVWDTPVEQWRRLMSINLDGVFHGIRSFVPRMGADPHRSYVANIASIGAMATSRMQAPYVASKHAVQALTEVLHVEAAEAFPQIAVSVVNPAPVATRIFTEAVANGPGAKQRRAEMAKMIAAGMHPTEAGRRIVEQILAGRFWVSSHPELFAAAAKRRAEQLATLSLPVVPPPGG